MVRTTAPKNRISQNGNGHAEQKAEVISLKPIDIKEFEIPLRGTSPLVVHKFSEKAKKQIEDKQQQKAKGGKEKRDPKAEYLAALYVMPGSPAAGAKGARYGIPASGFKKAAMTATRYVDGMTKAFVSGAFLVLEDAGGLIQIKCSTPIMREDTVRIGQQKNILDLRYRPQFDEWSCVLRIRYNASVISPEQIVNLFHIAGFSVGWGELRPEKGYSCGTWEIVAK